VLKLKQKVPTMIRIYQFVSANLAPFSNAAHNYRLQHGPSEINKSQHQTDIEEKTHTYKNKLNSKAETVFK
jgi:hypothetical protein